MKNFDKYRPGYYMPPETCLDWTKKERVEKAPLWCSVDLRDGNQALITPMNLEEKLEFYRFLLELGFKEIEVGFPAASETEFEFLRTIIEEHMIPDDVWIQVLTQSRPHIIKKTFEAIKGAKNVVVHLYNSTSFAQRQQVFRTERGRDRGHRRRPGPRPLTSMPPRCRRRNFRFEYSPESFTGTEMEFAAATSAMKSSTCGSPRAGPQGHHQPALHRGDVHAPCVRPADRVHEQEPARPRERHRVHPPPQRPRHCRGGAANWPCWPAATGSRGPSSATASAPATWTSSPWP